MKVLKFGGTSVGSPENIKKIIQIIASNKQDEVQVVVVSAFAKVTNLLVEAAQLSSKKNKSYLSVIDNINSIHLNIIYSLIPANDQKDSIAFLKENLTELERIFKSIYDLQELSPKSEARILSYGELLSSQIITNILNYHGLQADLKDSRKLICTNANYTHASVDFKQTNKHIEDFFKKNQSGIVVLPGFIAGTNSGDTTVLGRGGSDFTAAILAAALNADILEIWTDVSGMFTANPSLVSQAMPIERISYEEAMELSHFGAKVIYPPTIHPVLKKEIPILIKNTLAADEKGTLIVKGTDPEEAPVKGITHIDNITLITLEGSGMVGIPGFSKRLFETLAREAINVKLITQASSEHSICVGIDDNNTEKAKEAVDAEFEFEILRDKINPLVVERDLSIIAIVGDRMKSHQGISGKMFSTLGKNNVNIRAIAQGASERNISAVIDRNDVKKALNSLHERFFIDNYKQLNVYITGVGNVGSKLMQQIASQQQFLLENLKINLRVIGISSSKKMIFAENGMDLQSWKEQLAAGEPASLDGFLQKAKSFNKRNSIFVDITASEQVAVMYKRYLRNNIAVVACNKIACSAEYNAYRELKDLSLEYNAPFLFETNVGAGLPVIDTLNNLIASGDRVNTIQAVLSGSLNFVFNNFESGVLFHDIVKQAQDEGYTEPDPRIDLSGVDVARKILILARESGAVMDLTAIENKSFLTQKNLEAGSVAEFYQTLLEDTEHFNALFAAADAKECQLKYVAEFDKGKASVSLREIPKGHPFYDLKGKDNIVMFYTQRYPEQPMIIKGAGAGADVTASGLFADIIKIASN